MSNRCVFMVIIMAAMTLDALAEDKLPSESFGHLDWELACDNTRTCRAAGYQSDGDDPVSVLLTRKAGADEPVTGQLALGIDDESGAVNLPSAKKKLAMQIDGKNSGYVVIRDDDGRADLSAKQVEALLAALRKDSKIEWVGGHDHRWLLSGKGAAAILLKMDEFQGRVGTRSALIRKKGGGKNPVLPPLPRPVVASAPIAVSLPADRQLAKSKSLLDALRASNEDTDNDDCDSLSLDKPELSIERLTETKLLVSTECWRGAYNVGVGFWVIDQSPPYHPTLVTSSGSSHDQGTIGASQKGRGLGDCWSSDAWVWDGKRFVHSESSSTGMCKGFPGGAWSLPTLVTDVRPASR